MQIHSINWLSVHTQRKRCVTREKCMKICFIQKKKERRHKWSLWNRSKTCYSPESLDDERFARHLIDMALTWLYCVRLMHLHVHWPHSNCSESKKKLFIKLAAHLWKRGCEWISVVVVLKTIWRKRRCQNKAPCHHIRSHRIHCEFPKTIKLRPFLSFPHIVNVRCDFEQRKQLQQTREICAQCCCCPVHFAISRLALVSLFFVLVLLISTIALEYTTSTLAFFLLLFVLMW